MAGLYRDYNASLAQKLYGYSPAKARCFYCGHTELVPDPEADAYKCLGCTAYYTSAYIEQKEKEMNPYWEEALAAVEAATAAKNAGYITEDEARASVRPLFPSAKQADDKQAKIERLERELDEARTA
jgi:hypothetical protein